MTWIQRYWLRRFVISSVWLAPLLAVVAAIVLHRAARWADAQTHWAWFDFGAPGAQALASVVASSMLTFTVFTFSILLLAVQIAGAQLSPRIITFALQSRLVKRALAVFVFTFTYSMAVMSRIGDTVPQLPMAIVVLCCLASIGIFVYLVDRTARVLRPAGIIGSIAEAANEVIDVIYPHALTGSEGAAVQPTIPISGKADRTVPYQGRSGILQAVDAVGLAEAARRSRCTIRVAPQVGDFVPRDEPLFYIYGSGEGLSDHELHHFVAFGAERTMQQDPAFAFRIIVDIASKALSLAINDPSTACLALDQIHRLLRIVGKRYLGDGTIRDSQGTVRVILPTPNWEDFVSLGMSEIRFFGASSIQVVRRLRAMIENLLAVLPESRHPALREQLELLDHTVERSFVDPTDRAYAGIGDAQGVGTSRRTPPASGSGR
jgi:uncharacterized membrane protein